MFSTLNPSVLVLTSKKRILGRGPGTAAAGEGNVAASTAHKAQGLHTILAKILDGFVKIQATGFVWDLMYRGKLYKGIKFVPYIHFIACDT